MLVRLCDSFPVMRSGRLGCSPVGSSTPCRLGDQVGDRRRVAAPVVVEHDDDALARVADVVQRLVGHAAGHRPVADDGDDVAQVVGAGVAGDGQAVGVRQDRRGVAVLDEVVRALLAARVAGQAAGLAQLGEAGLAPGDDLVHVGLVAGVPDDGVGRRVEHPVQRQRQLDGAEVGPEVAAGLGHGLDDEVADLAGEIVQLGVASARAGPPGGGSRAAASRRRYPRRPGQVRRACAEVRSAVMASNALRPQRTRRPRHRRQQRDRPGLRRRARRARGDGGHLGDEPAEEP